MSGRGKFNSEKGQVRVIYGEIPEGKERDCVEEKWKENYVQEDQLARLKLLFEEARRNRGWASAERLKGHSEGCSLDILE